MERVEIRLFARRERRAMPGWLQRLDDRLFRAVASRHTPALDATLPRLSRAANHGRLWLALAAVAWASGDRRARRAAGRGVIAMALTSPLVNVVAKGSVRRVRPILDLVPLARRLARPPLTSSFPSGHAASAAAFATAAAIEMPAAAGPLGLLAGAVASSRVYVGAHFPSDVLVGAALGASVAVAAKRIGPSQRAPAPIVLETEDAGRAADISVALVVNPSSGPAFGGGGSIGDSIPGAATFELNGQHGETFAAAMRTRPGVLGVVGGDGTVNAALPYVVGSGVPMWVVPGGTLNHFAQDVGTGSPADAEEALRAGGLARVDVASIDGQLFVNTASFGVYPDMVDLRSKLEPRLGRWAAGVIALRRALRRASPLRVELDGRARRVWSVFVGNGRYGPPGAAPRYRTGLQDGLLDVRVLRAEGRWSRTRLVAAALTGSLARTSAYEEWTTTRVDVRAPDGPLRLARDGETFEGPAVFAIEKIPRGLMVLVSPGASVGPEEPPSG